MKVNIVIGEADSKWILGRLGRELNERLGWTINQPGADIDYCLPYLTFDEATAPIKVPLFTHREEKMQKKLEAFDKVASEADRSICLSWNTRNTLPYHLNARSYVIHLGTDLSNTVRFGVAGKNHASGRKNFNWVKELSREFDITYQVLGIDVEERRRFYNNIDYLIVTSSIEGGPVPVLDAIAMGVPVIAPDVGWCWDYPCIHYGKDDYGYLYGILKTLNTPRTWADVADDHKRIFEGFL